MKEADSIFMYCIFASLYLGTLTTLIAGALYLTIELYRHVGISGLLDFLHQSLPDSTEWTTGLDLGGGGL